MLILAAQPAQWESSVRRSSLGGIAGLDIAGNLLGAAGIFRTGCRDGDGFGGIVA